LGTVFSVCVVSAKAEETSKFLRSKKIATCATLPQAGYCYTAIDMNKPLAVVMGSEEQGLSEFWQKNSEVSAYIPMKGKSDSLNVSVSAAIVLYEAIRQREK
jgi:TrmH family RNA methyltransferase